MGPRAVPRCGELKMGKPASRSSEPETFIIESAAHDGRGISHSDGKVVFVSGALPGEQVKALRRRRRGGFDEAETVQVLTPSGHRVEPECAHFGTCGGCAMQHASIPMQLEIKQQALADNLERIGRVFPARWLTPLHSAPWHYRRRARLSCRYVDKKGRSLVGFRERGSPYVADLKRCEILAPPVGQLLEPLAALIGSLQAGRSCAQIEVAVGDDETALVLRHLSPLADGDLDALRLFATTHRIRFYLQPGGYDSIHPLDANSGQLVFRLPAHQIEIGFQPTDFIQVNGAVNRAMVDLALELLAPEAQEHHLDLFCGLGNFTLPLARNCRAVTGVEGDDDLVARARTNAMHNEIDNCDFHVANLFEPAGTEPWYARRYDGVLLDPPRAGAKEILPWIPRWDPSRVLYVSCHPGTLARDAGELVHTHGYRLVAAGIMDMFPHTAHVESIALFER